MKIIKKVLPMMFAVFFSGTVMAGTDPIKWELTQHFPETVIVENGTYVAAYKLTNQMPFTMGQPLIIQKFPSSHAEFSYDDLCTGKKLAYNESCTVTIYLNPIIAGKKTIYIVESYGHDQVPLPMLSTMASDNGGISGVSGVVTTALPSTSDIDVSEPWKFTYTNTGNTVATGINISVANSTYNTDCGLELSNVAPNNTCYVQGTYAAQSDGLKTVSVNFSYAQGSAVKLQTSTTVGGSGGLVCSAAVPFAPETLVSTSSTVTLLCTNKSGSAITITGHTPTYPSGGAEGTFTPAMGGDNCTAQSLASNASCQLSGTYVAPSSPHSNVTIGLVVNYNPSLVAQVETQTNVVTVINNTRTINLVNNCNFAVWWSMVGGAISGTPACTSNADCPSGSTCNTSSKICYYNNYGAKTGGYLLTQNGGTASTEIIQTLASQRGDNVLWKGLISASTQCSGTKCQNNDCQNNGGTTSCAAGVGFQQPATEAEFTLMLTGASRVDTYDISNVNGFSMPIAMSTNQSASEYNCGSAGNNVAVGNLKACNFANVTPPTQMYYWVTDNGACTAQNTCSNSGEICGLAFVPTSNSFAKKCGDFLGYWAANQICQTEPGFKSPFGDNFTCTQVLASPFPAKTYTLTQLLKCSPPNSTAPLFNSCYLSYSGYSSKELTQCCGCTNWPGIATPSESCPVGQTDSQWTTYVQPLIQWMKKACPTSYSYPFDDKASTFQCTSSSSTEYTITFCPGTGTGLPTGKTDGR